MSSARPKRKIQRHKKLPKNEKRKWKRNFNDSDDSDDLDDRCNEKEKETQTTQQNPRQSQTPRSLRRWKRTARKTTICPLGTYQKSAPPVNSKLKFKTDKKNNSTTNHLDGEPQIKTHSSVQVLGQIV